MPAKVLITERIAQEGIDAITSKGYNVDVRLDLTEDALIDIIEPYDALVIRSATKITSRLLDAAKNLKIIGRAGVTVDNIDLDAAAEHGVIVCNAPTSNIISAAEHTMALMLAAARHVAQANESMHAGKWERHEFQGIELYGKTLAIFGLGRVGSAVATRAAAFGMRLIAYDPYCSPERAGELDVELYEDMNDVIKEADIITVHLPRTSDTLGMFTAKEFAAMKNGVILINSARGGIYDVDSLADFVAAGKIAAAAIDIFEEEPCTSSPLHELDNVILTPHISAVTKEAQINAGCQIAEYIWAGLEGSIVPTAINATSLPPEVIDRIRPYIPACKMMGRIIHEILGRVPKRLEIVLEGDMSDEGADPLIAGAISGLIAYKQVCPADGGDAVSLASRHGIKTVTSTKDNAGEYASAVRIKADDVEIASTLYGVDRLSRIISILGYKIDITPAKYSLIFEYVDGPGRIGVIGKILGDAGINITTMQIGNKPEEKCALVYMNVEGDVNDDVIETLRNSIDLKNVWNINL